MIPLKILFLQKNHSNILRDLNNVNIHLKYLKIFFCISSNLKVGNSETVLKNVFPFNSVNI